MKAVLPLLALAALGSAQEIVVSRQAASTSRNELAYRQGREVTFTGRVVGKAKSTGTNRPAPVRVLVKSGKKTYNVNLGPTWFVADQTVSLNVGDKVTVTGASLKLNGENVINAKIVRKNGGRLVLRDSSGFPYWVTRRQSAPVEPASGGVSGRVARMTTIRIGDQVFNAAVVQTPNGEQTVAIAPDWYYGAQDIQLSPGAYIRAYGGNYNGTVAGQPAPGLFVVGSLYSGSSYYGFTNPNGYVYGNFPGFPGFPGR